jgi:hypothetical protein
MKSKELQRLPERAAMIIVVGKVKGRVYCGLPGQLVKLGLWAVGIIRNFPTFNDLERKNDYCYSMFI